MVPLDQRSRLPGALEQPDHIIQHGPLLFNISRSSEGMPQRPGHEHRPGRTKLRRYLLDDAHRGGGQPLPFHRVLNQPDRAVAQPSRGRQQRHLRPRLAQPPRRGRRRLLHEPLHEFRIDVAHEAHMNRRYPANRALRRQLSEPLVREDDVQVRIRPPVVVVIVRYRQRIARGVARNLAERRVAVGVFHVEGGLRPEMHPARRHQRDSAFAHGPRERRPGRERGPRAPAGHLGGEILPPRPSFHQPRIARQQTRHHPVLPPAQAHQCFLSVVRSLFGGGHPVNQRRTLSQRSPACTRR